MKRRPALLSRPCAFLAMGLFCTGWSFGAMAQGTGAKPIRVVVGFAAGSGADVTARLTSQPRPRPAPQARRLLPASFRNALTSTAHHGQNSTPLH